jgi:GNAT superfamily N-acetyltransferase
MSEQIEFRRCTLQEIVDLRHGILRAGLPRDTAIFPGDALSTTRHFGAFILRDGIARAVGCATFHLSWWEDAPAWQLRGMATAADVRGKGVGRALLQLAERELLFNESGLNVFWCNARVPATGFYELMGWSVVSDVFDIATAGPHVRMFRRIE